MMDQNRVVAIVNALTDSLAEGSSYGETVVPVLSSLDVTPEELTYLGLDWMGDLMPDGGTDGE